MSYTEEISIWKETSAENADSLITDVNVAKANGVKMSVKRILVLARFQEHVRALQALVNANVDREVAIAHAMAKVGELLKIGRSIKKSDYAVKLSELTREVLLLTGLVESKDLEFQTIPGLKQEASRL